MLCNSNISSVLWKVDGHELLKSKLFPTHIITKRQFVFLKCFIGEIACYKMYKMNIYYLLPQFRININLKVAFICLPFDSLKECIHRYIYK